MGQLCMSAIIAGFYKTDILATNTTEVVCKAVFHLHLDYLNEALLIKSLASAEFVTNKRIKYALKDIPWLCIAV